MIFLHAIAFWKDDYWQVFPYNTRCMCGKKREEIDKEK